MIPLASCQSFCTKTGPDTRRFGSLRGVGEIFTIRWAKQATHMYYLVVLLEWLYRLFPVPIRPPSMNVHNGKSPETYLRANEFRASQPNSESSGRAVGWLAGNSDIVLLELAGRL